MTEREFCFWLQGFFELNPGMAAPTPEQAKAIREHLALVFKKVTPPVASSVGGSGGAGGSGGGNVTGVFC